MRRLAQRLLAGILCGAGARGAVQATGRQRSRLSIAVMGASSSSAALWKQSAARVRTLLPSGVPDDRRIEFRIGIHLGDVVQERDDDLMGNGVNIAEGIRVAWA